MRRHPSPRGHSRTSTGPKSLLPETKTMRESSSRKQRSLCEMQSRADKARDQDEGGGESGG